ncbi:DUF2752 domain-containing protein [Pseudopedobacter beijingensis]|uniref:DUF2752 domain-containing protein n=1 Tax=Pseudopedobacter beijingensis TaxID=1207056 RepID=A0ABW4I935_9SPHI
MKVTEEHISLCPIHQLGFSFCPGCGLGRSIHYLMHGQWSLSWKMHPLGFFAFFVIISRICTLTKKTFLQTKFKTNHG